MSIETLARIRQASDAQRAARLADYRRLVCAIHNGASPDELDATACLEAAGKSPDDLAADLSRLATRAGLAEELAAGRAAEIERQTVVDAISAALETLHEAQRVYQSAVAPMESRLSHLEQLQKSAAAAGKQLEAGAAGPLKVEHRRAVELLDGKRREAEAARQRMREIDSRASQSSLQQGVHPSDRARIESQRGRLVAERDELAERLDKLAAEIVEAESSELAARERLRDPEAF